MVGTGRSGRLQGYQHLGKSQWNWSSGGRRSKAAAAVAMVAALEAFEPFSYCRMCAGFWLAAGGIGHLVLYRLGVGDSGGGVGYSLAYYVACVPSSGTL